MKRSRLTISIQLYALAAALAVCFAVAFAAPAGAAIPDDNGSIAFERDGQIWIMDADGANARVLVASPNHHYGSPSWSGDGTKIAYSSRALNPAPGESQDLWMMGADGSNPVQITTSSTTHEWDPTWSPDGSKIAFERTPVDSSAGFYREIWVVDLASGALVNLSAGSSFPFDYDAAWSPDGNRIAFTFGTPSLGPDIYVMDQDGSNPRNLTLNGDTSDQEPTWSPDGTRIAFTSVHQTPRADSPAGIWTINADGSGLQPLRNLERDSLYDPAWSPDGTQIAFHRKDDPGSSASAIDVMTLGGSGGVVQLTSGSFADGPVAWQPLPGVHRVGLVDSDLGKWYLREQGRVQSFFYGNPGDVPFLGDWDCDGKDTPGLYRQADGFVYLRNANTQGVADIRFFFGNPGDIPLAGDFDGDSCDTVSVYRPSEGPVFIHNRLGSQGQGLGPAQASYYFGNLGDKPFAGDFNGNGVDTVGLHRESSGLVYFRNSHTQGFADASYYFGNPGDRFVAGDWTQDGIDTSGLFRPTDTKFFFRNTNTQGNADAALVWGEPDWLPVAGEFGLK